MLLKLKCVKILHTYSNVVNNPYKINLSHRLKISILEDYVSALFNLNTKLGLLGVIQKPNVCARLSYQKLAYGERLSGFLKLYFLT